MARERLSATVDEEILAAVRQRVGRRGVSEFVNQALRLELERAQLADLVAELQQELGPPTEDELAWAAEVLDKPVARRRGAA